MHQFIDQFRILKVLNQGLTAIVYEAELNQQLYAIKRFLPGCQSLAQNEWNSHPKIDHPNLIQYYCYRPSAVCSVAECGLSESCSVIVMELAAKGQLFQLISRNGYLSEDAARTYFHMLLGALDTLHDAGWTHLDVKPENVLLDQDYQLKLSDFGFCRQVLPHDRLEGIVGTEAYMPPQMLQTGSFQPRKADIFSCGVVLFVMVTGSQPFKSASSQDLHFLQLVLHPQRFWDMFKHVQLSSDVKNLLQLMLDPNPQTRIKIQQIQTHAWFIRDTLMCEQLRQELSEKNLDCVV